MKYSILEDPRYKHIAEPKSILFQIFSFIFDLYANTVLTFYTPVKVIGRENIPKDLILNLKIKINIILH